MGQLARWARGSHVRPLQTHGTQGQQCFLKGLRDRGLEDNALRTRGSMLHELRPAGRAS